MPDSASSLDVHASARRTLLRDLLLVIGAGLLVGLPFLGQNGDWGAREVRHALISAEMAERGDALVPYLLGERYIYKPPVMHIPTVGIYNLVGGPSMFLARLPSALAGIASALAVYGLGRLFYGSRAALLAALMLLGTLGHLRIMRTARPDMCFSAAVAGSCALVVWGMSRQGWARRVAPFFLAGAAFGLANLSKGPYGVFYAIFPMSMVVAAPFHRKEFVRPRLSEWPAILLGFVSFPLAWIVPVYLRDNGAYLREVFGQYDPSSEHLRGFYYYTLKVVPAMLLPWMPLLASYAYRRFVRGQGDGAPDAPPGLVRAPLLGALFTLAALSAVGGKREHYLGPWYAFMVLELGCEAARLWNFPVWRPVLKGLLAVALLAPLIYFAWIHPKVLHGTNPEHEFAVQVVDALPERATVVCFRDMGEVMGWISRVRRWGHAPAVKVSFESQSFITQLETCWREGVQCFAIVREKDEPESIGKLVNAKVEVVREMVFEKPGFELVFYVQKPERGSRYRLYRIEYHAVSEKVASR